jgi:hypothetical protein
MKITIVHPSRQRAEYAHKTCKNWLQRAKNADEIEYMLTIDLSDSTSYADAFKGFENYTTHIIISHNRSAIDAINNAAKYARGNLLIVVSDDFNEPPQDWDEQLLNALEGKEDFIVKTDDGLQPWIITLPIMDRKYYDRFGYIYYPEYRHMFCDTEMTHVADLLDRKITLPIKFPHAHYTQRTGQPYDEVNKKNDDTWKQGEELYLLRVKQSFGLLNFPGKLNCAPHHAHWLDAKGVNL